MYATIKKYLKFIIPDKFLFRNEVFFRRLYSIFFWGNKHQCNVCNKKLRKFITLKNTDFLCPSCGSLSRNRRLWNLLKTENSINGNVLHFSPSRSLFRKLKKDKNIHYYATDFENEFLADYNFDITNIDEPNEKFDTIICFHILEHIVEDKKAIKELYRVLKPNGAVYIQTPFKKGDIYEDYSITSPREREINFGQWDHVRIYSVDGLEKRLEQQGFNVITKEHKADEIDWHHGFKSPETILIATKK